jgi:foldase protein PrsA
MKRKILIPLFLISIVYLLYQHFKKPELNDETIAIVDKTPISAKEFQERLNTIKSDYLSNEVFEVNSFKEILFRRMVVESIILSEAKEKSIEVSEEELERYIKTIKQNYLSEEDFKKVLLKQFKIETEWKNKLKNKLLIEKTLSKITIDKIKISEKEVIDRYENHYKSKLQEPKALIYQIFTYDKETIEKAKIELEKGYEFEKVAKKYSHSPEKEFGGKIGWFSKGEALEIFDTAFELNKGDTTGIIQSDYGYHILKIFDKFNELTPNFDTIKPYIVNELVYEKENELYESWLKEKLKNVIIVKNVTLFNSIN